VQANIQFSTASAYGAGLAGRLNPATGTRYAAYVYPENSPASGAPKIRLVKFDNWTYWSYKGPEFTEMAHTNLTSGSVGTNWHTLVLSFQGTNITVYFDGRQGINMGDAEATTYPTGGICTDMYSDEVPYIFSVTNVTVNLSP